MGQSEEQQVRDGVRRVYSSDRAWGRVRPLAGYQAMFPGYREIVAEEHRRLVAP